MKTIRNLAWRLVALSFLGLFGYAIYRLNVTGQQSLARLPKETIYAIYGALLVGFMVPTRILRIPSTLTHEIGHALMSSILRETVESIRVEIDTSGVTYMRGKMSRLHIGLRSIAGPLASSVFLLFSTLLILGNHADLWIVFTGVSTILITVTTVRSLWGWVSAAIITAVLFRALQLSLDIGSQTVGNLQFGIWANSQWNLALLIASYSAGIGIRYSLACRKPISSQQDEAKVAWSLRLPPSFGGHLILILNVILTAYSVLLISR